MIFGILIKTDQGGVGSREIFDRKYYCKSDLFHFRFSSDETNGKCAYEVFVRKNQINYELKVNDIPPNRVGSKLVDIYRIDKTPKEQFESQELLKYAKDYYRKKGTGRPTKKDRRNIDDYLNDDENT